MRGVSGCQFMLSVRPTFLCLGVGHWSVVCDRRRRFPSREALWGTSLSEQRLEPRFDMNLFQDSRLLGLLQILISIVLDHNHP